MEVHPIYQTFGARNPVHGEVEGNEMADDFAKQAAESAVDAADRPYLREASLAHWTRKTTDERTQITRRWIQSHVKRSRRHRPLTGSNLRPGLLKGRKEPASRYYQFLSGHASGCSYLAKIGKIPSSECWRGEAGALPPLQPGRNRARQYGERSGRYVGGIIREAKVGRMVDLAPPGGGGGGDMEKGEKED